MVTERWMNAPADVSLTGRSTIKGAVERGVTCLKNGKRPVKLVVPVQ